jgi:hypothetical protein
LRQNRFCPHSHAMNTLTRQNLWFSRTLLGLLWWTTVIVRVHLHAKWFWLLNVHFVVPGPTITSNVRECDPPTTGTHRSLASAARRVDLHVFIKIIGISDRRLLSKFQEIHGKYSRGSGNVCYPEEADLLASTTLRTNGEGEILYCKHVATDFLTYPCKG